MMVELQTLLRMSAEQHWSHLCPRQVLGVRMGLYAAELFGLELPQSDKLLFAFVESDGCLVDGITAATGCATGHRTMRIMDFGKTAATFVNTLSNRAIRILPSAESRSRAQDYVPDAPDRWHAQLEAYQVMPTAVLLTAQPVQLTVSLSAILSRHGLRVLCDRCGEDIINERQVQRGGQILCRSCAGENYYSLDGACLATTPPRPHAMVQLEDLTAATR